MQQKQQQQQHPSIAPPPRSRRHSSTSAATAGGGGCSSQEQNSLRLLFFIVGLCCMILIVRGSLVSSRPFKVSPTTMSQVTTSSNSGSSATTTSNDDDDVDLIHYQVMEEQDRMVDQSTMIRYSAHRKNGPVSVLDWAQALAESPHRRELAQDFNRLIQDLPYDAAVYMETKGASSHTAATKPFEVAFLSAPQLQAFAEANPDPRAFEQHFAKATSSSSSVCSFSNLGGDAQLISPLPPSLLSSFKTLLHNNTTTTTTTPALSNRHYSHLAAFARHAPPQQVTELWTTVASEYYKRLSPQPSLEPEVWWLNTEGTGVAWLHVRLDRQPKYYHYMPFAHET